MIRFSNIRDFLYVDRTLKKNTVLIVLINPISPEHLRSLLQNSNTRSKTTDELVGKGTFNRSL